MPGELHRVACIPVPSESILNRTVQLKGVMRILVANVAAADETSEVGHAFKTVAVPLFRRSFDLVRSPDTELVFRFPRRGLSNLEAQPYDFLHSLADVEILYMIMQAEREGFDGAIIACFHDPMLWSARQAVGIPVVGFGESTLLLATMMGRRFGQFCPSPLGAHDAAEKITRYGLTDRCVGIESGYLSGAEQERALVDARCGIQEFTTVAHRLISRGAEVIVPGCGLLASWLRFAPGCESEYPQGLTSVDGVPVADVYGAAVKAVETLTALKRAGSPWISRQGAFARPSGEALAGARSVIDYSGPGFWDC